MKQSNKERTTMKNTRIHRMQSHNLIALALAVGVALITPGCGVNRVLLADFDQYSGTPGDASLIGPIPGIPDGDRIENVLSFVAVVNGAISGKSLQVGGRVDFDTAPHETPNLYTIEWEGLREVQNFVPSTVTFLDDDGDEALVLRFEGQDVRQLSGDDLEPPPFNLTLGASHSLTVEIHMGGVGSIDVTYEDDDDSITHANLEFRDPDFDELELIRFEGEETYFLADLSVFATGG